MSRKTKIILYTLEVVAIIVAVLLLAIFKFWPEYQQSLGSSEKFFSKENYKTSLEIKVSAGAEFFVIFDKQNIISYIFFENQQAAILANQNIETKSLEDGITDIINKLIESNQITTNPITIINYGEKETFSKALSTIRTTLITKNIQADVIEQESSLAQKKEELNIPGEKEDDVLWALYIKSMDIIDKMPKEKNSEKTLEEEKTISKEMAISYADTIYQKLNTYMLNANIKNQNINDMNMPIQYIPGNPENNLFPTTDSWYYIKEYKIYAEISIPSESSKYTFCYQGTKESRKEGTCK